MFMENNGSIRDNLKMRPSGRNEGLIVVVVDESSRSPFFDGNGQSVEVNEQVGGNEVAIEKT